MKLKNKFIAKVGFWYFRFLALLMIISVISQIIKKIN
jgi:hypothetical protein